MKKQAHVYYSGSVQGVGFRYTAQDLARERGVCGWVKNLADARVELFAEAEETAVKEFLQMIDGSLGGYIRDKDIRWQPATGEFNSFEIKF